MPWARELKKLRSLFFVRFKMTGEPLDIVHGKKKKQKKKKKRKKKGKKKRKKKEKKECFGCSASELLLIVKSSRQVLQDFDS